MAPLTVVVVVVDVGPIWPFEVSNLSATSKGTIFHPSSARSDARRKRLWTKAKFWTSRTSPQRVFNGHPRPLFVYFWTFKNINSRQVGNPFTCLHHWPKIETSEGHWWWLLSANPPFCQSTILPIGYLTLVVLPWRYLAILSSVILSIWNFTIPQICQSVI